jgi:hypothetical protein
MSVGSHLHHRLFEDYAGIGLDGEKKDPLAGTKYLTTFKDWAAEVANEKVPSDDLDEL